MTDKEIIRLLPTQPLCEVLKATMECPELHPSFITFKRVSVETGRIEWQELMTPEDMDTSVSLTVLYILIEVEGEPVIELDKLNEVFKVNGIDMLAEIKEMC